MRKSSATAIVLYVAKSPKPISQLIGHEMVADALNQVQARSRVFFPCQRKKTFVSLDGSNHHNKLSHSIIVHFSLYYFGVVFRGRTRPKTVLLTCYICTDWLGTTWSWHIPPNLIPGSWRGIYFREFREIFNHLSQYTTFPFATSGELGFLRMAEP